MSHNDSEDCLSFDFNCFKDNSDSSPINSPVQSSDNSSFIQTFVELEDSSRPNNFVTSNSNFCYSVVEPVQYSDNSSVIHNCVELEHSSSSNNSSLINPVVGLELSSSSNNSVASNSNFCYSTVKNYSKPPFYCTCNNKS